MPRVLQVICSEWSFEEALPYSHRRETAQVRTMQLFMQRCFQPQNAHQEAHWGETAQVPTVQLLMQ